jgi:hypothetical protein
MKPGILGLKTAAGMRNKGNGPYGVFENTN